MSVVGKSKPKKEKDKQNEHLCVNKCCRRRLTALGHATSACVVCCCLNMLLLHLADTWSLKLQD